MSEAEIQANAESDPDSPPLSEEMLARATLFHKKVPVSLRLDEDIVQYLKTITPDGRGYQTIINRVLRQFVEAEQKRRT
jgi:uncharacterized protein (DUF4415 family)